MKYFVTFALFALSCVSAFSQQKNSKIEYTTKDTPLYKTKNQAIDNFQTPNWEMQAFRKIDENSLFYGISGIVVEGDYYYVFYNIGGAFQVFDTEGNFITWASGSSEGACDVANDGTNFYMGATYEQKIYVLTHNGGYPNEMTFDDPISVGFLNTQAVSCVAYDSTTNSLWIAGGYRDLGATTDIYNIDMEGNILNTISASSLGLEGMISFAYYNDGTNPYLWIAEKNGMLNKLDLNTEQIVQQKDMGYLSNEIIGHNGLFIYGDMYEEGKTTIGGITYDNYFYAYNAETMIYQEPDAGIRDNSAPVYSASLNSSISGTIKNYSPTNLSSVNINWNINDGEITTENINLVSSPLGQFEEHEFTLSDLMDLDPELLGTEVKFKIWTSQPNGGVDDDNFNDTLVKTIFVGTGISGDKKILIEPFLLYGDLFWDLGWTWFNTIVNNNNNEDLFTAANIHRWGAEWDEFGIFETGLIVQDLNSGTPKFCIDRYYLPGQWGISAGAYDWEGLSLVEQIEQYKKEYSREMYTPCNIDLEGEIDTTNNSLNVSVITEFVDYAIPADYRVSMYLIEDNAGNIEENDYTVRAVFPVENIGGEKLYNWGAADIIPTNPIAGNIYTAEFNEILLDPSWKIEDLRVIGFVSYYNDNTAERNVLNSNWEYINTFPINIGIDETSNNNSKIYPNPAYEEINIESNQSIKSIQISDITGNIVKSIIVDRSSSETISIKELSKGIYLVKIAYIDNNLDIKKIIKK